MNWVIVWLLQYAQFCAGFTLSNKEWHLEIPVNFNSWIYTQRIYECEESYLAGTFSAAVNSPLFFIFVQDSIVNAYSRSDLDHFGNQFIFFSLKGKVWEGEVGERSREKVFIS